jgi:Animal haem peroxidase
MSKYVTPATKRGISRRDFARGVGIGAGVVAAAPATLLAEHGVSLAAPVVADQNPLNFGRIFNNLPPFAEATDSVIAALRELGAPGGIMDAKDNLAAGPVQLIVDPALSANNPDNPNHTAGTTFVGQFIEHDVTFDTASPLGVRTEPTRTRNTRVPTLDLDSVYGGGPAVSPQLYQQSDRAKLRIESGGLFEDVPRNTNGSAIIGDPRNDENIIIAGLHAAFILFHNNMADLARAERLVDPGNTNAVFTFARNETRWHYHSMILSQFLPQVIGAPRLISILLRRRFYRPASGQAFMPVEFQTGAYRMGHSMVRPSYRVNFTGQPAGKPNSPQFFGFIFDPGQENIPDSEDIRGGSRAPRRFIGWPTFFDFVTTTSETTRSSTPGSRPRCSSCRCSRSRPASRRRRWPSATCCATSRGRCRPGRPWRGRYALRR